MYSCFRIRPYMTLPIQSLLLPMHLAGYVSGYYNARKCMVLPCNVERPIVRTFHQVVLTISIIFNHL